MLADFRAEGFADAGLFAMTVRVGLAVFLYGVAFPFRAFGDDQQRIVAGIIALVRHDDLDQFIEIHLVFGDAAADRTRECGVERSVPGVASEDAENTDAFMGADGGALPLNRAGSARDSGGE